MTQNHSPSPSVNYTDLVCLRTHLISSDLDSESAKAEEEIHRENSADQRNLHSASALPAASVDRIAGPEHWDELRV
jgi:hypothetical protein